MSEWQELKLSDAPLEILDGDRGKNYPSQDQFMETGHCLFLSTKNVRENGFDFSECQFITKERDELLRKGKLNKNDLVLTTRGTVGNIGFNNESVNYKNIRINSGMVIIRPDEKNLSPNFNFYLFRKLRSDLDSFVSGSAQPQLPIRDLKEIEVVIPGINEQKAIASVLSSLDDKIDLLHRQNKTLESLAETLFRHWFIDQAHDDWEENSLLDVIELIGGGTPKTSRDDYWNGDIPWLSGGDISSNHKSFIVNSDKKITDLGLENSSAKLLPKHATVISARGTVGKFCLLSRPMTYSQSNYGILPKYEKCYFFTYLLINHIVEELQSSAYGSVFDTITTATFRDVDVKLPSENQIIDFNNSVKKYFEKILLNVNQTKKLENLRDTLLPKLLSGEVRVKH